MQWEAVAAVAAVAATAALALLVVIASAIALLRMRLPIGRLLPLLAAGDERGQAIDLAVVLLRPARLLHARLLVARRIELGIAWQVWLGIARTVARLLAAHLRRSSSPSSKNVTAHVGT
jgi:hypothetical protein